LGALDLRPIFVRDKDSRWQMERQKAIGQGEGASWFVVCLQRKKKWKCFVSARWREAGWGDIVLLDTDRRSLLRRLMSSWRVTLQCVPASWSKDGLGWWVYANADRWFELKRHSLLFSLPRAATNVTPWLTQGLTSLPYHRVNPRTIWVCWWWPETRQTKNGREWVKEVFVM
jgi:hypothetical protein